VLLDLHLPDPPGDELPHRLKAVPELADIKVVVVSADATPGRVKAMLDPGSRVAARSRWTSRRCFGSWTV